MRLRASVRLAVYAVGVLLLASPAVARDTVFSSPPIRSPVDGELECAVLNTSAKKSLQGVTIGFRRVNGGTSGATETCGDTLAPLTGCTAKLAGYCESLPCACIFTISRGDKKAVRGTVMSIDADGTVTGTAELRR